VIDKLHGRHIFGRRNEREGVFLNDILTNKVFLSQFRESAAEIFVDLFICFLCCVFCVLYCPVTL
jgi:hypothetical protein